MCRENVKNTKETDFYHLELTPIREEHTKYSYHNVISYHIKIRTLDRKV